MTSDHASAARTDSTYPDLSQVVQRVSAPEYVNDPTTHLFLAAGEKILTEQLVGTTEKRPNVEKVYASMLQWISRPQVAKRAGKLNHADLRPTEHAFRKRWREQMHYVRDLLAYVMRDDVWRQHSANATAASADLFKSMPFDEAIEAITYREISEVLVNPSFSLQATFQAMAQYDSEISAELRKSYAFMLEAWSEFYEQVVESLGVRLRPGVDMQMMANALNVAADGTMFRLLAGRDDSLMNEENRTTVLGFIAKALVVACFTDEDDPASLDDVVRAFSIDLAHPTRNSSTNRNGGKETSAG
ncbi:hypothetical protein K4749_31085 [Streptomyces sp. TRM72054]|uniref:hypothetical protein n=1 Tax=Streptomyces sp. TRM72054 TaxID=2870562 RepID=UPI001C8B45B9|nr:hypothetical protein [Streptomyces sp. TRM72054]MBX9397916.1 hypothetical protein [Streptomyces sp. TRM72054]